MRRTDPHGTGQDAGYTLIEVTVAMAVMLAMATSVLAILTLAARTSAVDRQRVAAANLAAREIEVVRNAFHAGVTPAARATSATAIANAGDQTNPDPLPGQSAGPLKVDGTSYTVVRQVSWLPLGSGKSACDGGNAVTYPGLAVHVVVTWPGMKSVKPVVSDTVLTPPKGVLSSAAAFAAVRVRAHDGQPYPNRTVSISGPAGTFSDVTGPDGCAVFSLSSAGSYTTTLSEAGFVGADGNPAPTLTKAVAAGTVQAYDMSYDVASKLQASFGIAGAAPDGGTYVLPTTLPGMTIANSHLQPVGVRTFATGTTLTPGLFPWPEGYTAWAGTCSDADPAGPPSSGLRSASGGATAGQTDAVVITLRPLKVSALNASIRALTTLPRVMATSTAAAGCASGDSSLTLGRFAVEPSGDWVLRASLPPGAWSLKVVNETGATVGSTVAATLNQNGSEVTFT